MIGDTGEVISAYTKKHINSEQKEWIGDNGDDEVRLVRTYAKSLDQLGRFHTAAPIEIGIEVNILSPVRNLILGFSLFSEHGQKIAYVLYDDKEDTSPPLIEVGILSKKFLIPQNTLAHGKYRVEIDIGIHKLKRIALNEGELIFSLVNISGPGQRFPLPDTYGLSSFFRPHWSKE